MNQIQLEDCQNIGNLDFIEWKQFENSTILITGSTGLIGQNLVNAIAYNSQRKGLGIKLILLFTLQARQVLNILWKNP